MNNDTSLALAIPRCEMTTIGAEFSDGLTVEEWRDIGRQLERVSGAVNWVLGDWWNAGARFIGADQAVLTEDERLELVGRLLLAMPEDRRKSLRCYAWVAQRVPRVSRLTTLSWSHHQEVAALPRKEQKQWLARAERQGWSRADLREAMGEDANAEPPGPKIFAGFGVTKWISEGFRWAASINPSKLPQDRRAALRREIPPLIEKLRRLVE